MVNYTISLDTVFGSLADPTRRDILSRLRQGELNISEVAEPYHMSLAAISKHPKILEQAQLISKRKEGKERSGQHTGVTLVRCAGDLNYATPLAGCRQAPAAGPGDHDPAGRRNDLATRSGSN